MPRNCSVSRLKLPTKSGYAVSHKAAFGRLCAFRALSGWRFVGAAIFRVVGCFLFRPSASHFCRDKSNQNRLPLHPALRFAPGAFTPSSLQGHAPKGHPWPIVALAASMPLNPFHDDSVHPPEGALARLMLLCGENGQEMLNPSGGSVPKLPSGGRVEVLRRGVSRMDAARGITGQGWPVYAGPRSGTGRREVWP